MKKVTFILIMITLLMIVGCKVDNKKNSYLPEAKNDEIFTTVGGDEERSEFCFVKEDTIIELNTDMSKLQMQPTSVEQGSGDGFKWTINKYEDVEIKALISDDNKALLTKLPPNPMLIRQPVELKSAIV